MLLGGTVTIATGGWVIIGSASVLVVAYEHLGSVVENLRTLFRESAEKIVAIQRECERWAKEYVRRWKSGMPGDLSKYLGAYVWYVRWGGPAEAEKHL